MEQKKEKKYIVGSILCGLLTAFGIAATVISLLSGCHSLLDCINLVTLFLITFYAFIGYRKPHGNLLKYTLLICTIHRLFCISELVQTENTVFVILHAVEIGLLCYIAGRLAKIKENLILMTIATICLVAGIVPYLVKGTVTLGVFAPLVIWLDICVAYFLRYKQHKEAGLEDAPKSK